MELFCTDSLQVFITLFLGFVILAYIYGQWPMSYWKTRNIQGPPPLPFIGNTLEFRKHGMHNCLGKWTKQYGRVFGVYFLRKPLLVVSDPDMLKEIMVKNFSNFTDKYTMTDRTAYHPLFSKMLPFARGAEWKRMRIIVTPAFSSYKLKSMEDFMNQCSARLAKTLCDKAASKESIDTKELYGTFTLDLIAAILFGFSLDSMADKENQMFHYAKTLLNNTSMFKFVFLLSGLFPILQRPLGLLGVSQLPKTHFEFFIETFGKLVEERRKNGSKNVDFLQLLINAEAEEIDGHVASKKLSSTEIIAQLVLFFVAGYETTASTLQYISHHIAKDQTIQDRLISEMEELLGDDIPNAENLQKLKYMDAVITETLRLYPSIPYLTRETIESCVIKGVEIVAGTGIFIPALAIGRDPEFYNDPEAFNPERFMDETVEINQMSYLPFGVGPRQCIGMRLAIKEIKIALVHVLRQVRFTTTTELQWPKSFNPTFLQPVQPAFVTAELRH